jgi:hypothetical protein
MLAISVVLFPFRNQSVDSPCRSLYRALRFLCVTLLDILEFDHRGLKLRDDLKRARSVVLGNSQG